MFNRVIILIYVSYDLDINMITKTLKDSWCVRNWIEYIKYYIFVVNVIRSRRILSNRLKILKGKNVSFKNEINRIVL